MNFIKNLFSQAKSSLFNWLPKYSSSEDIPFWVAPSDRPPQKSWFGWLTSAKEKIHNWWNEEEQFVPSPLSKTWEQDSKSNWTDKFPPYKEPIDMGIYTDKLIMYGQDPYEYLGPDPNETYRRFKEGEKRPLKIPKTDVPNIKFGKPVYVPPHKSQMQANIERFHELKNKVTQTLKKPSPESNLIFKPKSIQPDIVQKFK